MVTERRRLSFSPGELRHAIELFREDLEEILPPGDIIDLVVKQRPELHVSLTLESRPGAKPVNATLSGSALGAAIVHYCLYKDIPMPRAAEKTIEADGEGLVLCMSLIYSGSQVEWLD
ncbi:MAG: hypothetical protein AAF530_20280 [Pseudomonadota bacterium]